MSTPKRLFVAATRQNDGKTMVSLGLFNAFQKRFNSVSYIKPVGQQYRIINGLKIDKDAALFSEVYGIEDDIQDLSPIAVPSGFTSQYIENPDPAPIHQRILDSFNRLGQHKDFILIEGTGHAGVGSVFDTSNGRVANLLNAKVVLVSPGGIGRAIDEIALNKASFEANGATVLGVIVNKIHPEKFDKIKTLVQKGLSHLGLPLLGAIPYEKDLVKPSLYELSESLNAEVLANPNLLSNTAEKVLIGAMAPHDMITHFQKNTVLVVPGNRDDVIMTALYTSLLPQKFDFNISGMIFTGNIRPNYKIFEMISHANIPVMLVEDDSFSVATKINNMLVKIRSNESEKIDKIQQLVEQYVDVDHICKQL
jgi:BioD-like phosphotransacetylase family protein